MLLTSVVFFTFLEVIDFYDLCSTNETSECTERQQICRTKE